MGVVEGVSLSEVDRKHILCLVEDKSHFVVAYCHLYICTVLMVVIEHSQRSL